MKLYEKHHPESRRLWLFKAVFGTLFSILFFVLFYRQTFQNADFLEKERKQGQRRIIRPGPRGDVLDREGNLLIGNRAHFSATLHIEQLKSEIWENKVKLRKLALQLREELSNMNSCSLEQLLVRCSQEEFVQKRKITLYGQAKKTERDWKLVRVFLNGKRQFVIQDSKGNWEVELNRGELEKLSGIIFEAANEKVQVNVAGLFTTAFKLADNGSVIPFLQDKVSNFNWIQSIWPREGENRPDFQFSTSGFSIDWESRYATVLKYLEQVNRLTSREEVITMDELKSHWRRRLVLPLKLANNLRPEEYAILVEEIAPESPIQVQAEAIRHYPEKSLASHVLGYVGSGYEADPQALSGADLATFEIKGRTGKAGIEKEFDSLLRGKDGGDIWRVNPMGSRFDRIERSPSMKGKSLQLSLDRDLQRVAEQSLDRMIDAVASRRTLPDANWRKTIERRTRKALEDTNERDLSPELLISAFVDAPFPLNGEQASTVAGFNGTTQDADRLLHLLYSRGVLSQPDKERKEYVLAPPLLPPAAAVLLDLNSYETLVLASKPAYNLEELSPFIPQSVYDHIQRREAWLPRACHPGYAPASPFKLVTALAGIRHSVLNPEEKILCKGIHRGMECHVFPGSHGEVSLRQAIAQSCNVYFFKCAERMGYEALIEEAKFLGFTENPQLQLPSLRDIPIVPDPAWKKNHLGVKWTLEDTFNISIGQGGLRQSPLQMACFAAKLANNSTTFVPTLLRNAPSAPREENSLDVNSSGYQAIIEGMALATTNGTARRCKIEGIEVAGKTGTGQWRNRNMELNLAWFIGFAPVKKPEVAIAVLVEGVIPQDHIQGGLTATPVAKEILSAYFSKYRKRLASSANNQNP